MRKVLKLLWICVVVLLSVLIWELLENGSVLTCCALTFSLSIAYMNTALISQLIAVLDIVGELTANSNHKGATH